MGHRPEGNRYGKFLGETYPRIALQFMRQGYAFDFELVTWWQINSSPTNHEIKVEICKPTVKQIERIHAVGSCIIINKFTKDYDTDKDSVSTKP